MKAALACAAIALLAGSAVAQTNAGDVAALTGLQACVAANAANLAYVYGWNTSNAGSTTPTQVPGAAAVTAQLAAAGVPGVTAGGSTPAAPGTTPSTDPCGTTQPWTGLLCSGGRVTTITMAELGPNALAGCNVGNLTGLSGLSAVTQINMQAVGLTGQLPAGWSSGFQALQQLTLSQNSIQGSLPSQWSSGFPALNTLDVNQNTIGGSLPSAWGSASAFPSLLNLVLGNNSLTGVLPLWTGGFQKAQLFGLSANELSGVLPDRWAFPALTQLQLENNMFDGCIPGSWPVNFPNLTHLNVANNDLEGAIPTSYDEFESLTTFTITPGNMFCGSIDQTLAETPAPETQGNRFQPEPTTKNSQGGYTLSSCPANLACPAYSASGAPAPAPGLAPTAAVSSAGRRLLAA